MQVQNVLHCTAVDVNYKNLIEENSHVRSITVKEKCRQVWTEEIGELVEN